MHAWRGRFTLEEGAAPAEMQMQWKEEREATLSGGHVEAYARALVAGAFGSLVHLSASTPNGWKPGATPYVPSQCCKTTLGFCPCLIELRWAISTPVAA